MQNQDGDMKRLNEVGNAGAGQYRPAIGPDTGGGHTQGQYLQSGQFVPAGQYQAGYNQNNRFQGPAAAYTEPSAAYNQNPGGYAQSTSVYSQNAGAYSQNAGAYAQNVGAANAYNGAYGSNQNNSCPDNPYVPNGQYGTDNNYGQNNAGNYAGQNAQSQEQRDLYKSFVPKQGPQVDKKASNFAAIGLAMGIISFVGGVIPLLRHLTTLFAIAGIIFSAIAINRGEGGMAILALVLSIISLVVSIIVTIACATCLGAVFN